MACLAYMTNKEKSTSSGDPVVLRSYEVCFACMVCILLEGRVTGCKDKVFFFVLMELDSSQMKLLSAIIYRTQGEFSHSPLKTEKSNFVCVYPLKSTVY